MLAYVFWHRPAETAAVEAYERDQERWHRSLAARPPEGFHGSVCFRATELPWLGEGGAGYEDWYLIEDWAAVGVLRQAAVAAGHRGAHDAAARHSGAGAGGLYRLDEGAAALDTVELAVWVTVGRGQPEHSASALLLGDGLDPRHCGLWRRELVLGPAPEYCVLGDNVPRGVGEGRLPHGWTAQIAGRVRL